MEHLEYYGLPADPFQNDADARFYYESAPQKRARLRLLRGIHQRKALAVLVGGPGLGKTTLAQAVLRELEAKDYAVHYLSIPHEACASNWLLPNVARGFGVPVPAAGVQAQIDQIHTQLTALSTAKRSPVLLIDEAQLFRNREAMEEFRGLLNLTHEGKKLLSLVLFGLPELNDLLKLDPPLAQRVEVRVEMEPMDWLESQAYVSHRLRLAGAAHPVFSPDALEVLFRWSGGVPRVLNTLADNSLFEGFLNEKKPVDSNVVQTAANALGLVRLPSDSVVSFPVAPPAPELLGVTEVDLPPRAARKETMPVSKPSPMAAESKSEAAASPDWLEPLAPMPADTALGELEATLGGVGDYTEPETEPEPVEADAESDPELEIATPAELDLDLEEVVAEDTLPPTPVRARAAEVELEPMLAEPEPAEEAEEGDEPALGLDSDDEGDFSLRSLVNDGDEEEDALANLGAEPEPEDLAPVRRTLPLARPSPMAARPAAPATPARATLAKVTPAKAAPAKPVAKPATPAKATPARATPAKPAAKPAAAAEDGFDLRSLVDDEPESPRAALVAPAKDSDDDDLDALFDEIQIGDK